MRKLWYVAVRITQCALDVRLEQNSLIFKMEKTMAHVEIGTIGRISKIIAMRKCSCAGTIQCFEMR